MARRATTPALTPPIFVIGAPRSGTTFLFDVLSSHPGFAAFNEPRLVWRYGNDRHSDLLDVGHARPRVERHIRDFFLSATVGAGAQGFVEKTPANALRIPFVETVFPGARYIVVYRNGIDSVASAAYRWEHRSNSTKGQRRGLVSQRVREGSLRQLPYYAIEYLRRVAPGSLSPVLGRNAWGPRLPGIHAMMSEMTPLDIAALQWRACCELSHRDVRRVAQGRFFEVRIEDLDEVTIADMAQFLGLDESCLVKAYQERSAGMSPVGRSQAAAADVEKIMRWIAPTMEWLGYTEIP